MKNFFEAPDTLLNNSCDVPVTEKNNLFISTVVDEVWRFIKDSGRSWFDCSCIKNIIDDRMHYTQLCDALLEKYGEEIELVQGKGRSQILQRRINYVSINIFTLHL